MITGINHITIAVTNIDQSFFFYTEIMGFKPLVKWDKGAYFLCGDLWYCLTLDENVKTKPDYSHFAFTVPPKHFGSLSQKIIDANVQIFKDNISPGDSLYFLDPDGHKLEIHTGDWKLRLEAKKKKPGSWKQVKWF